MITLEIKQRSPSKNIKLMHKLNQSLLKGQYFHFFLEPNLIIRLDKKENEIKKLLSFLKARRLKHNVYQYPFPKNKKDFGESKKGIVNKHFDYFKEVFGANSRLVASEMPVKERGAIIERYSHSLINQMGLDWTMETKIHLTFGMGRMKLIRHYERLSPGAWILATLIIQLQRLNLFLLKGLYYK